MTTLMMVCIIYSDNPPTLVICTSDGMYKPKAAKMAAAIVNGTAKHKQIYELHCG